MAAAPAAACGPRPPTPEARPHAGAALLPDIRVVEGRPPVVLVSRDGDPAAAVAVAVTTAGLADDAASGDDPEIATGLAALVEARLRARGIDAQVTPSWDGLRASALASSEQEASRLAEALRDALTTPAADADVSPVRRKLMLLGQRPLRDRALGRWARCVGEPYALPDRAGKDSSDVDLAKIERWRAAALGLGRVTFAVTGAGSIAEAVAGVVLRGPTWKSGARMPPASAPTEKSSAVEPSVDVYEAAGEPGAASASPVVHVTLDVGTSSAAVATAEALGDPRGPLAARLSELDLPFRLREVTGTANVRGGCVGVVLEAQAASTATTDLAVRVADAVALVRVEASVRLEARSRDGLALSRRSGDSREAAELGAWWALASMTDGGRTAGSIALGVPARRGAGAKETALEPSRDALAAAMARAMAAWDKPVVEGRTRVESGQGEAWMLLASPCGTEGETDADTGLTALFTTAAAGEARVSDDVRVEPWVTADGAGVLVHGPALPGESASALARRLADVAARSFAAEPITGPALARARAELLRRDARGGSALAVLASALAPQHPSWIDAWGSSEPLARSSDGAVLLRAQSLRAGPLRLAVLANVDGAQADAAVRAADRWVGRRTGEARSCRAVATASPPRPGTYSAAPRPGAVPEAYLAFPFPAGDEGAYRAALVVVAGLDDSRPRAGANPGGEALLAKALGGSTPLARESSAKVLGWPRAPALVVRIVAAQATLDAAVMQTRALIDRLHAGGLAAGDFERAVATWERTALAASLDPRARVVATWRGEPIDGHARLTADDVRAFTQKHLAEDTMIVVASRPGRPPGPAP